MDENLLNKKRERPEEETEPSSEDPPTKSLKTETESTDEVEVRNETSAVGETVSTNPTQIPTETTTKFTEGETSVEANKQATLTDVTAVKTDTHDGIKEASENKASQGTELVTAVNVNPSTSISTSSALTSTSEKVTEGAKDFSIATSLPSAEASAETQTVSATSAPSRTQFVTTQHQSSNEAVTTPAAAPVVESTPATNVNTTLTENSVTSTLDADANIPLEESGNVSALYVGRVIGKGGEMIRDLQARSGCRIDVDQNVPEGAPRVITYRGTRRTIDFAKRLIEILCSENGKEADLPLGEASRKHLVVPANVIGKIIGRGGEMIRELQSKSQAKIQVDHTGAGGVDPSQRQVTVTGTEQSVVKAEEMINFLTANPTMDAMQALAMLIEDKTRGGGRWGSGPPYASMPNGGVGMDSNTNNSNHQNSYAGGYGNQQYGAYAAAPKVAYSQPNPGYGGYQQHQQHQYTNHHQQQQYQHQQPYGVNGTESEIFPCPKMYMGRVIGQKGATINDVQKRSGCDIQINQDVAPGQDCEITIRGSRQGIESAKSMLREIIELGPNHSYAGGRGGGGGGGQQYGSNGHSAYNHGGYHQRQNNGYGTQQHYQQQYQQQQPPTMQVEQQGYNPPNPYGNQFYQPQNYAPQQGYQTQPYPSSGHQPYGGNGYGQQLRVLPPMQASQPSPWKSATAADGQTYYYNEKTGETQWDKPPGM